MTLSHDELCGVDLARNAGVFPEAKYRYEAGLFVGQGFAPRAGPRVRDDGDGRVCAPLAHFAPDSGEADDAPSRYLVVDVTNGQAPGPLRAHLYDLGPARGFRLVGVERPDGLTPPG